MVFGSTKSPIDLVTQASLEFGLQWIAENFGARRMLDAKVVPDDEPVLEVQSPLDESQFSQMVDFLSVQLGVDPDEVVFDFVSESQYRLYHVSELAESDPEMDQESRVDAIEEAYHSRQPSQVVSIDLAVWLASFLYRDKKLVNCPFVEDYCVLDELLCLFQGMGPIFSRFSLTHQKARGTTFAEAILGFPVYSDFPQKQLALSTIDLGSILGIVQFACRDHNPTWMKQLRADVRKTMKSMIRYLEKSDPFFGPETLFKTKTRATEPGYYEMLRSPRVVDQIIAMNWFYPQLDVDSIDPSGIIEASHSKMVDLRVAATTALQRYATETDRELSNEIRQRLIKLVGDRDGRIKAAAAYALSSQPLNESMVITLCDLLHDSDREVAQAAGFALRQSRSFAEKVIPEICRAISFCVVRGESSAMETMVDTLDEICDFPEEHLVESLDNNEHDFLFAVTDVLRDVRLAKKTNADEAGRSSDS